MDTGKVLVNDSRNGNPDSMSKILDSVGFTTISTETFDKFYDVAVSEKPHVILIDLDKDETSGLEMCRLLKDDYETRKSTLVVLSSENSEDYVVKSFEAGADDFISKPFGKKELIARLKATIRRINRNENKKIKVKDIEIDLDEHKVLKGGKTIDLTYIQFKLLYLLASRRENVFSRKEILEKVWGRKVYVTNRTVDVHIKRLREKLGEYKYPSQYIETIHGTGYRFM